MVWFDLSGCQRLMASIVDATQVEKNKFENIAIVRDFLDVFPEELPGVTIKFKQCLLGIELLPGMTSVPELYVGRHLENLINFRFN